MPLLLAEAGSATAGVQRQATNASEPASESRKWWLDMASLLHIGVFSHIPQPLTRHL